MNHQERGAYSPRNICGIAELIRERDEGSERFQFSFVKVIGPATVNAGRRGIQVEEVGWARRAIQAFQERCLISAAVSSTVRNQDTGWLA